MQITLRDHQVSFGDPVVAITDGAPVSILVKPPDGYNVESELLNMSHVSKSQRASTCQTQVDFSHSDDPHGLTVNHLRLSIIARSVGGEGISPGGTMDSCSTV